MDITFNEIRAREIVSLDNGKRLGRAQDIVFDKDSSMVLGIVVPGVSRFLRKSEDIYIPNENIKKIGDDVILVTIVNSSINQNEQEKSRGINAEKTSYIRYKKAKIKIK